MSTLFRCPPNTSVKHEHVKLPEGSTIATCIDGAGQRLGRKRSGTAAHDASPVLLRDDHIVLLAIDGLLALHAAFKKWRQRRTTLRAIADLDERQLRDIGLTRDHKDYYALTKLERIGSKVDGEQK